MFRRLALITAGVLFMGVLAAAPAVAQVTPGGPGYARRASIKLCSTTAVVGQTITITGMNFASNEDVTANINPTLGHTTADSSGGFTLMFEVPSSLSLGPHTVTVTGNMGSSASAMLTIVSGAPTCGAPTAPVVTTPTAPGAAPPSAAPPSAAPPSAAPPSAVTPPAPSSGLAFTGAEISLMAVAGAVLLVVGGMLVLTTRKRRSSAAS